MFKTAEEITRYFINDGWSTNISFRELSEEEASKNGCTFLINKIKKGNKFYIMNICNNIYDEKGKLIFFGNVGIVGNLNKM